ncbi:hypothetical protein TcBrA4_0030380 [Trypanosoma cruzi]|nr:hypothetical protein TcBrA4_0030380 [Trypanosoma cruzi]
MPRGGRHAGGARSAPNGTQGRSRNSPDHYYFSNRGGDGGGFAPSELHLHWCVLAFGSAICELQGRKAARHCGKPGRFVMRTVVTPRQGGPRIGRHAAHLSVGTVWSNSPGGVPEREVCPVCMRHAGAQFSNRRGNGGCGVTLFVRGRRFGHALMRLPLFFFTKAARRRLSALSRGIVLETSPTKIPPAAVGLGEGLQHIIENNRERIITDASLHGWGVVFISDSVDVKIAGGNGRRGGLF